MSRTSPVMVVHHDPDTGDMLLYPEAPSNIESALQAAAVASSNAPPPATEPTIEELMAQLARPFALFLRTRFAGGQMLSSNIVARILNDNREGLMAVESTLLLLQYFLDRASPPVESPNWEQHMEARMVYEEYIASRLKDILTLPCLRK